MSSVPDQHCFPFEQILKWLVEVDLVVSHEIRFPNADKWISKLGRHELQDLSRLTSTHLLCQDKNPCTSLAFFLSLS